MGGSSPGHKYGVIHPMAAVGIPRGFLLDDYYKKGYPQIRVDRYNTKRAF